MSRTSDILKWTALKLKRVVKDTNIKNKELHHDTTKDSAGEKSGS
jgi:hypothetical protein